MGGGWSTSLVFYWLLSLPQTSQVTQSLKSFFDLWQRNFNATLTFSLDLLLHENNFLCFKLPFVYNFDELPFHYPINVALPDQGPRVLSVEDSYVS
ncbi:hypothetical protein CSIM01_06637 [Colletotrichum simmondsii]|uniref:Uncharacterized protein n=1 Tax=Colletotrichum simmondsii TaxID=703756 RepID=A0A135SUI6_9PEZI|nr:hypothetical protein CSIM01_06637 [Colletotrichum simmondsii]